MRKNDLTAVLVKTEHYMQQISIATATVCPYQEANEGKEGIGAHHCGLRLQGIRIQILFNGRLDLSS